MVFQAKTQTKFFLLNRPPVPSPTPPSPLQDRDAYNDAAWGGDQLTYDVVLLDSASTTERGRELLLRELEDVSKTMPLPLPLPLRKLLKEEPIVADEDWQNDAPEIEPSKGPSINDVRKLFGFFDPSLPCPHLVLIYCTV